jgi:hypothetical protein
MPPNKSGTREWFCGEAALREADSGLLHAVSCTYAVHCIDLLIVLSQIHLTWPNPAKVIQAAREALDLATHPDSQYNWGEADAAQVRGEAYFANHGPALAHRAFTQALAVRKRIEHPGVAETEKWLAMTGLAPMTAAARHPPTIESERSERVSTINGPATCSNAMYCRSAEPRARLCTHLRRAPVPRAESPATAGASR